MSEIHVTLIESSSPHRDYHERRGFTDFGQMHNLGIVTMNAPRKDDDLWIGKDLFRVRRIVWRTNYGKSSCYAEIEYIGDAWYQDKYPVNAARLR